MFSLFPANHIYMDRTLYVFIMKINNMSMSYKVVIYDGWTCELVISIKKYKVRGEECSVIYIYMRVCEITKLPFVRLSLDYKSWVLS